MIKHFIIERMGICKLFGNVKLQRGASFLTGDYAEVDLNKGLLNNFFNLKSALITLKFELRIKHSPLESFPLCSD